MLGTLGLRACFLLRKTVGFLCGMVLLGFWSSPTHATVEEHPHGHFIDSTILTPDAVRVAYIHGNDLAGSNSFVSLLTTRGFSVDQIAMADAGTATFDGDQIIILASDTGSLWTYEWGTPTIIANIQQSKRPVVGIGWGGAAFFSKINASIGLRTSGLNHDSDIVVVDSQHSIWTRPTHIPIPANSQLSLYPTRPMIVSWNYRSTIAVRTVGRESADQNHYPLVVEYTPDTCLLQWGYVQTTTTDMTPVAQDLFINSLTMLRDPGCSKTGFWPIPAGYQFINPGRVVPSCTDFQRSYSGLPIECSGGIPHPDQYHQLFEDYKRLFGTGICTGMATSSLAYYYHRTPLPAQYPTTYDLPWSEAQALIFTLHGRQQSQAVLNAIMPQWQRWTSDPATISQNVDTAYAAITNALSHPQAEPVIIDLFPRPGANCGINYGHSLTPYRIDRTDPQRPKVYVYENFAPGNENKAILFDFTGATHHFTYEGWSSLGCGAIVTVPLAAFLSAEGTIPSDHITVTTGGNMEPMMINAAGETIGIQNGQTVTTMVNAMPVFPWYTPSGSATIRDFVLPTASYTATLSTITGPYTYTAQTMTGTLSVRTTAPGFANALYEATTEQIIFDRSLSTVSISRTTQANGADTTIKMIGTQANALQTYVLDGFASIDGGTAQIASHAEGIDVISRGLTSTYRVFALITSSQGRVRFLTPMLPLERDDTVSLALLPGETTSEAWLSIDHQSDGTIDESYTIPNQVHQRYMPIMTR